MLLMSMNHKKKRKKIVFFGDSITEFGTRFGGYMNILKNLLQEAGIDDDYELTGAGVAGDKIDDLYLIMDEDVLAKGADIVVVFIGVNDVGHKLSALTGTDIIRFEASYIAIIEKLLAAGISIVLCTPAVIGESATFISKEDEEINLYGDVIRTLALKYELPLVDLRQAFIDCDISNKEYGILTTDKVHSLFVVVDNE